MGIALVKGSRPLTADELGEKGESRFRELCADGKLVANKSERDLLGTDFIVTFPMRTSVGFSLDRRPISMACHVQVKTMWDDLDEFSAPLGAMERLAKEPKPAFVYVLKVSRSLVPTSAYLIHLRGENLDKVLGRLRAEAETGAEIRGKSISFRPSRSGQKIDVTGAGLSAALTVACGASLIGYVRQKAAELERAGSAVHTILLPKSGDDDTIEFLDAMLGLKTLKLSGIRKREKRFGVELEDHGFGAAFSESLVTFSPVASECSIVIRSSESTAPVQVRASGYVAKLTVRGELVGAAKILSSPIDIIVRPRVIQGIEFVIRRGLPGKKMRASEWKQFHLACHKLGEKGAAVEVRANGKSYLDLDLDGRVDRDADYHLWMAELAEHLERLADYVSGSLDEVDEEWLKHSRADVVQASRLLGVMPLGDPFSFTTDLEESKAEHLGPPEEYGAFFPFLIGGKVLAVAVLCQLKREADRDRLKWTIDSIERSEAEILEEGLNGYVEFVARTKEKFGVDKIFKGLGDARSLSSVRTD